MESLYGSRTLTAKERIIIKLVAEGLKNKEIAHKVGLQFDSLRNSLRVIFDKTGMGNRLELALWAMSREKNQ